MKNILSILLLLLLYKSYGQKKATINGVVTDKSNGETLFGATIFLKDTSIGTTTNEYGFFSLTAPKGTYTLIVSYVGFSAIEQEVSLKENTKINFELSEISNKLEEVMISSESKRTNLKTPQMSVSKLSNLSIKKIPAVLGEVDVIKSIQLLPGITNAGEGASGFNVRGGAEDQNLVLLDEAIIYNSSHLFGFFSVFNNDAIKNIKLYKGGIPSRFGGRASSVLDIRQKDGNKKQLKLSGGVSIISSKATLEAPIFKRKGSFLLAGRTTYANLFLKLMKNENRAGFYDFNLKTNYEINDNNKLYLSGYYGNDQIEFGNTFINSFGNFSGNLRWNHIFNDKLFSNLSSIYSRYTYDLEIDFVGFEWKSDVKNYNLKYDFGYYANEKIKMNFGISGIYYDFNPGKLFPSKEESKINTLSLPHKYGLELGAYAGAEQKITKKLTLQYGLRYSYFNRIGPEYVNTYSNNSPVKYNSKLEVYERTEPTKSKKYKQGESIATFGNLEPRLAVSYQINDKNAIKASYNKIAQYLHLISNTASSTPLDIWAPSGKFLKPQIANQYVLGYFKNFNNNTYSIEAETYYKTVDNRVDYINGAELIAQKTIEREILIGHTKAYGLEFLIRKNTGNFTGWLSYTLSKSEQQTKGGKAGGSGINNGNWYSTPYDRTHDFSFTGSYKLNDKWSFGGNFIFQTGRPVTYPDGKFTYEGITIPTYSSRNTERLPAYHRLDLSATLTPKKNKNRKWKGEWVFSIYNIYNRKNAASISFEADEETRVNEAVKTHIFGIIPSIAYNFKL